MSWALSTPTSGSCGAAWEASEPAIAYVNLSCTTLITGVAFASFGTPTGSCETGWVAGGCNANTSVATVTAACVGKSACSVPVTDTVFGDPCPGVKKELAVSLTCSGGPAPPTQRLTLDVTVPIGATAVVALPLLLGLTPPNVTVMEGGAVVWAHGSFVQGGAVGVLAGGVLPGPLDEGSSPIPAIGFRVQGGGRYSFDIGAAVSQSPRP